jgi:ribosome biogenesis GTPase
MAGRRRKSDAERGPTGKKAKGRRTPAPEVRPEDGRPGRVVAHHGVAVLVRFDDDGEERQIWLTPEQRAVAGDRVLVEGSRLFVEPAHGVLQRRDARGRERTIATNLDVLAIVVAPEPREPPGYIDRGFVIARAAGIEPIVVLNKVDLEGGIELADRLTEIYAPPSSETSVLRVSALSGEGIGEIVRSLSGGRLGALVGPSGVGKSSLLNALVSDLELAVSELNRSSRKGRHTTTTATLHSLEGGGLLVDTAGFKDFIAVDVDPLEAARFFPGFETAIGRGCRFRDCLHRSEPDCAILAAIEAGEIAARRHRAYTELLDELESSTGSRR